jgi:hypothetical protein
MAEKPLATVLRIADLGEVQLAEGGSEEQIELDIQVQQGELGTAKSLRLSGPGYADEIEFRSIYLFRQVGAPPGWARIICSRARSLTSPTGDLAGWTLTGL